jgi:uncharacterized membrane protein
MVHAIQKEKEIVHMKKHHRTINILLILVAFSPLVYLAMIWSRLPDRVPVHFNGHMQPDQIASKNELWIPVSIISGVSILVLFLLQNLHLFDPKRKHAPNAPVFNKLAAVCLIFMTILNFLIITASYKGEKILGNFLYPLLGLLFAFIGNYMHTIKPNYFAGIRLPWTLSDDENWRLTHRLAGKLWFWGGLLIAVTGLFIPVEAETPVFIAIMVIIVLIPVGYSYQLFRHKA